jgi:hypothetical protein
MDPSVPFQAIEMVLSSIYKDRGDDGLEDKFVFGHSAMPAWTHQNTAELFFRQRVLTRAALYVRKQGPAHFRFMSIRDISTLLRKFITANYAYLFNDVRFDAFQCSYAERVSRPTKQTLAQLLGSSPIFHPANELTLYPLVAIKIDKNFDSEPFFVIRPGSLNSERLRQGDCSGITPEEFPPFPGWQGRKERPASWLGVRAPIQQAANKIKSAILGAIALTPHPHYRHMFSGRNMFGGFCTTAADHTVTAYGDAHTPPMYVDITLGEGDHAWLAILAQKLPASDEDSRRQMRALEYFYRAWPLDERERFPCLFMALDAIFGDPGRATQAVVAGAKQYGATNYDSERVTLLMKLRGSVIHGGAPDVYESEKYHRYYDTFGDDPIFDLELIVALCLRTHVFGGALVEHPDPYADVIRAYRDGTLRQHGV